MGHYACDMHPEWFGEGPLHEPASTDYHWVVGDDFVVQTAIDFERSCGSGRLAYMERMQKKHHEKREDAESEAEHLCLEAIAAAGTSLKELVETLKDQPWKR